MLNFKSPLYFCCECKKVVDQLDDLLFVEEQSHKGFCSEQCIEDFYFSLIKHYEMSEHDLRDKLNLLEEVISSDEIDEEIVEQVLNSPTEIYKLTNDLQESVYHFIKTFPDFTVIVAATVYRKEASFIFLSSITRSQLLVNEFRFGEKVSLDGPDLDESRFNLAEDIEQFEQNEDEPSDDEADMIFIQLLESKKSKILADVILAAKDDDISFENYPNYEFCFQETLESPEEVFEKKDNEGDMLFTYIKSFSQGPDGNQSFYYIVICLKRISIDNSESVDDVNVYPILALPTNDMHLCQMFRGGMRLSGPLKN